MRISLFAATLILGFVLGILVRSDPPPKAPPLLKSLGENTGSNFSFQQVIQKTTGHQILIFDPRNEAHSIVQLAVLDAAAKVSLSMSREDSPARSKNRINEVSSLFEDALKEKLDAHPDLTCEAPKTKSGGSQRSGYPDLRIEHLPSGTIAYLDPKLFAADSRNSTFRTFYFEPGGENSKVTEDALHFLLGFPHDGKTSAWTFDDAELVDLSQLTVTLKTEFSASNKEVYSLPSKN